MSNPVHPDHMTPAERMAELASILASGLIRLVTPKLGEELSLSGEASLDFDASQNGVRKGK